MFSRRGFLGRAGGAACAVAGGSAARALAAWPGYSWSAGRLGGILRTAVPARHWLAVAKAGADCAACHGNTVAARAKAAHPRGLIQCQLCAQRCAIPVGERGRCRARQNVDGQLRSLVYGRPVAAHVDPIEKKPFYHFLPGARAYSLGTAGCPLRCQFCQNWEISQSAPEDHDSEFVSAEQIVALAAGQEAPVIAFTYNEPTVFTEYLLDIARAARRAGRRSVLVSCGLMNEAPLAEMCDALDAIKIDLKGFSEEFYRDVSGAALAPVLRSLKQIRKRGLHLEIVNLVVPTLNDAEPMLKSLAAWILGELGPDVPVHFTRFHPDYKLMHLPPTPVATLERAREIAMAAGLHYVYVGNVPGHAGNDTYCPRCGQVVLRRAGFFVTENRLKRGLCPKCQLKIPGVWS